MNGITLLIVSQIMLGSVAIFARWAHLPATTIVFFRCFFAACTIGSIVYFQHSLKNALKWNKQLGLLVLTGLLMASNWYFFFQAVLTTTITNSILLYNLAPIFVLLSAMTFLKETATARQVFCIAVSFLGVVLIMAAKGLRIETIDLGCVYAILAAALYSQVTVIGRYLKSIPAPIITLFQTGVGALVFLPLGLPQVGSTGLTGTQWAILITMGVFHTAVPYLMYFKALQTVKAAVAGILQYLYTLSTIAFGVVFFRESVSTLTIVGGAFILVSSYIALKMPGKRTLSEVFSRAKTGPTNDECCGIAPVGAVK